MIYSDEGMRRSGTRIEKRQKKMRGIKEDGRGNRP